MIILELLAMAFLFWLMLVRPNQKKKRQQQEHTKEASISYAPTHPPAPPETPQSQFERRKQWCVEDIQKSHMSPNAEAWFLEELSALPEEEQLGGEWFYSVQDSIKWELPYCCMTESEFSNLTESCMAVIYGDVGRMEDRALFAPTQEKRDYWKNRLCQEVRRGNYSAIYNVSRAIKRGQEYPDDIKRICDATNIEEKMKAEDPWAMLAWARHMIPLEKVGNTYNYRQKWELELPYYEAAAKAGLTDGYYYWVGCLWSILSAKRSCLTQVAHEAEEQALERRAFFLYKQGAELANGVYTVYCQYQVAQYYDPTEKYQIVESCDKDLQEARRWYRKAAQRNYYPAKVKLEELQQLECS